MGVANVAESVCAFATDESQQPRTIAAGFQDARPHWS
jgi:hypothetical protein